MSDTSLKLVEYVEIEQIPIIGTTSEGKENVFRRVIENNEEKNNILKYETVFSNDVNLSGYNVAGIKSDLLSPKGWEIDIPNTRNGWPVRGINDKAFLDKKLSSLTIGQNVTKIGTKSFAASSSTNSANYVLNLPKSIKTIGESAFQYNTPKEVRYGGTIDDWIGITFGNSPQLFKNTNLYLNDSLLTSFETSKNIPQYSFTNSTIDTVSFSGKKQQIGAYSFYGCQSLNNIKFRPSGTYNIGNYAFAKAPDGLTRLDEVIVGTNVEIEVGEHAFRNQNLFSGDNDFWGSLLSIGQYAFYGCDNKTVVCSGKLESIGQRAFYNNTSLELVDFFNSNISEVPSQCFYGCSNLRVIKLPQLDDIAASCLQNCSKLTQIWYNDTKDNWQDLIEYKNLWVRNGTGLSIICTDGRLESSIVGNSIVSFTDGGFYIPEKLEDSTYEATGWEGWSKICESITIPAEYNGSKITALSGYSNFTNLKEVNIEGPLSTINLYTFDDCPSLLKINYKGTMESWSNATNGQKVWTVVANGFLVQCTDGHFNASNQPVVEDPFIYDADGTLYSYSGSLGQEEYTISNPKNSFGSPFEYISIGEKALSSADDSDIVTKISFNIPVKRIGDYAFQDLKKLEDVDFNQGIGSIGYKVFDGCDSYKFSPYSGGYKTILYKENGNIKYAIIGYNGTDSANTEVSIPTGNIHIIAGGAFENKKTTTYQMGTNIKYIGYKAFARESGDTLIINFSGTPADWENVEKESGWAPYYVEIHCSNGEILDIYGNSLQSTITYTDIDSTTCKVTAVDLKNNTTITIPSKNGEKTVTEIGSEVFYEKTQLEEVILPNTIETIGEYAFYGCTQLTTIDGGSFTEIKESAFEGCNELTTIDLSSTATFGKKAFYKTSNLKKSIKNTTKSIKFGEECFRESGITSLEIGTIDNLGNQAFYSCSSLQSVKVEDALTFDNGTTGHFYNCTKLSTIELPTSVTAIPQSCFRNTAITSFSHEGITGIGYYAFQECTKLVEVDLPNLAQIQIQSFYKATALTTVNCPKVGVVHNNAFEGCTSLINLNLFNESTQARKQIYSSAFSGCTSLTSLSLSVNIVSPSAFSGCINLVDVEFTSNVTINKQAFSGCTKLSYLISHANTTINEKAFENCTNLKVVIFLNGVTINQDSFYNTNSLKDVYLCGDVKIGFQAFNANTNGTRFICSCLIGSDTFNSYAFQEFQPNANYSHSFYIRASKPSDIPVASFVTDPFEYITNAGWGLSDSECNITILPITSEVPIGYVHSKTKYTHIDTNKYKTYYYGSVADGTEGLFLLYNNKIYDGVTISVQQGMPTIKIQFSYSVTGETIMFATQYGNSNPGATNSDAGLSFTILGGYIYNLVEGIDDIGLLNMLNSDAYIKIT